MILVEEASADTVLRAVALVFDRENRFTIERGDSQPRVVIQEKDLLLVVTFGYKRQTRLLGCNRECHSGSQQKQKKFVLHKFGVILDRCFYSIG